MLRSFDLTLIATAKLANRLTLPWESAARQEETSVTGHRRTLATILALGCWAWEWITLQRGPVVRVLVWPCSHVFLIGISNPDFREPTMHNSFWHPENACYCTKTSLLGKIMRWHWHRKCTYSQWLTNQTSYSEISLKHHTYITADCGTVVRCFILFILNSNWEKTNWSSSLEYQVIWRGSTPTQQQIVNWNHLTYI